MLYILCTSPSSGARDLVLELHRLGVDAKRLRQDGTRRSGRLLTSLSPRDLVVGWGEELLPGVFESVPKINSQRVPFKWEELAILRDAGVATPRFSLQARDGITLPRRANHQGGNDFINPPSNPDYYVERLTFEKEFRIHIFDGVSIRAGIKVHREDFSNPHPWVRSFATGWKLDYGTRCQQELRQSSRDIAREAVEALGLDFGAVDVGCLSGGNPVVLEVGRRPGLEGNTLSRYAEKLKERYERLQR